RPPTTGRWASCGTSCCAGASRRRSRPTMGETPSQTVGPFLAIGLIWADGPDVVPPGTAGEIVIAGRLTDGAGSPVPDGLIETWQADPDGRFDHPDDPRAESQHPRGESHRPRFRGFGRCAT